MFNGLLTLKQLQIMYSKLAMTSNINMVRQMSRKNKLV